MNKKTLGKKAQVGIPLLIAYIIFNILLAIVIIGFGKGGVNVGQTGAGYDNVATVDVNSSSTDSGAISIITRGWANSLGGLPWWLNMIFVTLEVVILALSIYAIIRGV